MEKDYPRLFAVEAECLKMRCFVEAGPDKMPDAQEPPPPAKAEKRAGEGGGEEGGKKLKKV